MVFGKYGHHGVNVTSHVKMVPDTEQELVLVRFITARNARDQTMKLRLVFQECALVRKLILYTSVTLVKIVIVLHSYFVLLNFT